MRRRLVTAAVLLAALASLPGTGCARRESGELVVFAAASLTGAFGDIARGFEAANPGAKVTLNFAGSQQLAQQIAHGAPADVFASANARQMDAAVESGRVAAGAPRTFARNRLVVVAPRDNPARVAALADLGGRGLKLVLAAREVPAGQYALEMLDKAGLSDAALPNVVSYEQDVKAVLAKVALGEADAGVVYASDVAGASSNEVATVEIPDAVNVVAAYPIAALEDSARAEIAKRFVAYVLSPAGQEALARRGFVRADAR